jgi:ABC-type dipeptide/oligopeptide/nickel transport system permease subunit
MEQTGKIEEVLVEEKSERLQKIQELALELWRDKAAFFGVVIVITLIVVSVLAPLIAPYDPAIQDLRARLQPPVWLAKGSWQHLLGTDHLGRDILSRIMHGGRVSLFVGAAVVFISGSFGVLMGLLAGYRGGKIDSFVMRWIDTQVAFPGLLLALIILAVIGPSVTTVIVVLSLNGWMVYGRMTRSAVLSIRQNAYVECAEILGCKGSRVIGKHILPNLTSPLITLAILEFARIVLAEAALSFLGLGIQPPATSWGLDVATGKNYIFRAWWLVTMPGLLISIMVLAVNLVASWLRLISDPNEREKQFARKFVIREKRRERKQRKKERITE